jgi:CHAT domain-containing protein/Tfp pilus assembly protein PilF
MRIAQPGVVVEEVSKGSAGERAGILAGDILLGWERPANPLGNPETAEGKIDSVFDWLWVEIEQGPRAAVTVRGERARKSTTFDVASGSWGIKVRPRFDEEALQAYLQGREAVGAKQLEKGLSLWGEMAKSAQSANATTVAWWLNMRIGDTWAEARRWKEAQTAYNLARGIVATAMNTVAQSLAWDSLGVVFERQNTFEEAENAYRSAMAVREKASAESLSVARSLNYLGILAYARRDLAAAESYHKRALTIRERLAPDSLDLAASLNHLGNVAWQRNELATAEAHHIRALAVRERLAPDSLDVASSLNNLGLVAWDRGDLASAAAYHGRALKIKEILSPDSLTLASSLSNLGLVARDRGELAIAEDHYRRALAIQERLAPNSLDLSAILNNLGIVTHDRGDLATTEGYYKRALAIREKLAPDSLDVASSLNNLGLVAWERGDLVSAEAHHKRSLSIKEKLSPDSLTLAFSLNNLGIVASTRGDLASAEAYQKRALAIQERLAPDSLAAAESLNHLGIVARDRDDLRRSEAYHKAALAIRAKLGPGSSEEAGSLHDLGLVYLKTNQIQLAGDHLRRAIDALESQLGKLGGSQETQSGFGAQFSGYYRDYIDFLIKQNQPTEAFHILERSRARTLLAMLAERDLVFTADVPEELERERKRIAWAYDQTQAELTPLNPLEDKVEIESLLNRLRELRDRQAEIVSRIRQKSPRLASLQYPQVLDVDGVRAVLDPGTLVLSYTIGKDKSYLFALAPNAGVQVYPLAIGETQLRAEVERFRSLIGRAPLGDTDLSGLVERGRRLYDLLVQPAATMVDKATRLLVVPDGPLHALPFAALVHRSRAQATARRDWEYLIEWKPLHAVVSATVYAELRKARHDRATTPARKTLIAFGDPTYPTSAVSTDEQALDRQEVVVRSMLTSGYRLTPLPATRHEVAALAGLYGEGAEIYLGSAATEERAKSVANDTKNLHFASHALLDERFPLNSGLALAIPGEVKEGQDNGILQAWEIFERLRIDADLVVLSACETGLGKEMGGEGLVGLTRAFHYAGARSVLASLWSVADDTTAVFMTRFYRYMRAAQNKDAALRQAQLDLIRGSVSSRAEKTSNLMPDPSHPFYWAAFQLSGDWR